MIIQCQNCSRKFLAKDSDIPTTGRTVQCGYCSTSWHQMPSAITKTDENIKKKNKIKSVTKIKESLSTDIIKASDGINYKFLGNQWAVQLSSGKTGILAKKKISKELDKLSGRKVVSATKKKKKTKKEFDPSLEGLGDEKKLPQVYVEKSGLGFLGYIFLIIIIGFSFIGILKTFESDLLNTFPQMQYIYDFLDLKLEFFSESVKNMIVIINDLINSY